MKGKFPLKGITKQLIDMETGELVLLNDKKSIAESEMLSLRKIEEVLIQSWYVETVEPKTNSNYVLMFVSMRTVRMLLE